MPEERGEGGHGPSQVFLLARIGRVVPEDLDQGGAQIALDAALIAVLERPTLRIGADDYLSAKSDVFRNDDGSVTYDFRLEKGAGPSGIVYEPNGVPAEDAKVYVLLPDKYLGFENGRSSNPEQDEWAQTDEDGEFLFPALLSESAFKLIAIHDEGFAEVTKASN